MFVVLLPTSALASITEGGTGMIFGSNHAFTFTAPEGWVLDNQSGVQQGLHMIFYPVGESWSSSPVMAYGASVLKNSSLRGIEDQVNATVQRFHREGNPNYSAESKERGILPGGKMVYVYFFQGDQWGNYEAVGYIEEPETINFLVYNARNKTEFEKHLPAFRSAIATYRNMFESTADIDKTKFSSLIAEAKALKTTKEGKAYHSEVLHSFGGFRDIMKSCTALTTKGEEARFDLIFRIQPDGTVSEAHIRPNNALTVCVRGLVLNTTHPPHKMDPFWMYIAMIVEK